MYGAANPLTLPSELISAMPPAAAAPVRKLLGNAQKVGSAAQTPIAQRVTATIAVSGEFMCSATGMLTPPSSIGAATCQTRSPVRSPWDAHSTISSAPTT